MSGQPALFFEDFIPGHTATYGPVAVTAEDIVSFARQWDPQPMHLDGVAPGDTRSGGLCASGWHSCCLLMRIICDGFLLDTASMGGPGVEEVRWLLPVRPGDVLTVRREILDSRVLKSRPDVGVVRCRYDVTNQEGRSVMVTVFPAFVGLRPSGSRHETL